MSHRKGDLTTYICGLAGSGLAGVAAHYVIGGIGGWHGWGLWLGVLGLGALGFFFGRQFERVFPISPGLRMVPVALAGELLIGALAWPALFWAFCNLQRGRGYSDGSVLEVGFLVSGLVGSLTIPLLVWANHPKSQSVKEETRSFLWAAGFLILTLALACYFGTRQAKMLSILPLLGSLAATFHLLIVWVAGCGAVEFAKSKNLLGEG